jgi:putative tricarboxylic transport membrane protein
VPVPQRHRHAMKISTMDRKEALTGLTAAVIGLVVAIASWTHNVGTLARPGPFLLPLLTGLCLAITGLYSLFKALSAKRPDETKPAKLFDQSVRKVIMVIMAMAAYSVVVSWIGYSISTFLLLIFLFKTAGFHRWINVVLTAFVVTISTYLLFGYVLKLRFPAGIFSLL